MAFALEDAFPVSEGHAIVVPRQHVRTVFDLPRADYVALMDLVAEVRDQLMSFASPDGFNVGMNDGSAAGQTVEHAHIHVIPRHLGDVADPRGGIRWVLPERAPYWDD